MSDFNHPEWLAVGATVTVVRGHGRSIAHQSAHKVVRQTKTLVILDNDDRFKPRRYAYNGIVQYEMTPAYLDYWTRLEAPT